jgi:dihydrofolate reductase
MPNISIVVAMASKSRIIGNNGELPWKLPSDLKRFKELTMGHPVIMGRKTWESIPDKFRPLSGRKNIVMTRDESYKTEEASVVHNLDAALTEAGSEENNEIFVIGGAEVYQQALPIADMLYITEVEYDGEGDVVFPENPFKSFVPATMPVLVEGDDKNSHESTFAVFVRRTQ